MRLRVVLGIMAVFLGHTLPAGAQTRGYVLGTAGYGSLGDDEGSLGRGGVWGTGAGWMLNERLSLEGAVTRSRHARSGSLGWEGDPLAITLRGLYRFGAPGATVRIFAGGGAGYFRYPGTFTETIHESPGSPARIESRDWLVNGQAFELGAGMEVNIGAWLFVRPEAWVTLAGVERVRPAPEPPYALPRMAVSGGVRF